MGVYMWYVLSAMHEVVAVDKPKKVWRRQLQRDLWRSFIFSYLLQRICFCLFLLYVVVHRKPRRHRKNQRNKWPQSHSSSRFSRQKCLHYKCWTRILQGRITVPFLKCVRSVFFFVFSFLKKMFFNMKLIYKLILFRSKNQFACIFHFFFASF
jgi:hypothetical protein